MGARVDRVTTRVAVCVITAILALSALVAPAEGTPSTLPTPVSTVNGPVLAVRQLGSRIYLGGTFNLVGPPDGHAVVVDRATAERRSPTLRVNGTVQAITPDGSGGWYLGGLFTYVNGVRR